MTVPIVEGKVYRIGEMKIEGNSIYSEDAIRSVIGLNKGDIANGEKIGKALFENLKKIYGSAGLHRVHRRTHADVQRQSAKA